MLKKFGISTVNGVGEVGTNLSYAMIRGTIMSLTTDSDGKVAPDLDVGIQNASAASDDWSSNGVIVGPCKQNYRAGTIVMNLSVVG